MDELGNLSPARIPLGARRPVAPRAGLRRLLAPAWVPWPWRGSRDGGSSLGRGVALSGLVWPGGAGLPFDGVVVVAPDGLIAEVAPAGRLRLPADLPVLRGAWVGPGVVDAHVHLSFGSPAEALAGGLVAVRDLGAPPARARGWQTRAGRAAGPAVAVAGPVLTAAGGYPSTSWGRDGFAAALADPDRVRRLLRRCARDGADLVKVALEPGDGQLPVPTPEQVRTLVRAAHEAGLAVSAHALTVDMVTRALDAGVDELAHTPQEVLPPALVERLARNRTPVVSTLQTFFSAGRGRGAALNAAALHGAGVPLIYGTDLGNQGTRPGVDPRELDRLADAGLGRAGALRAATEGSAGAAGMAGRGGTGRLEAGEPARVVLLGADPLLEPAAWRHPLALVVGARLHRPA